MPTIIGTTGHDMIEPVDTSVAYVIYGLAGSDVMRGGVLNDVFYGDDGDDYASAGPGADLLYGDAGDDLLVGGSGNDTLYGGTGQNYLEGNAGNDIIYSLYAGDQIFGGDGADTIWSAGGWIEGGEGNDIIHASGSDGGYFYGGGGADTIYSDGNGWIYGDDGNDRIYSSDVGPGTDIVEGGAGNDTFYTSAKGGSYSGGIGNDVYVVQFSNNLDVNELVDEGYDIVRSTANHSLQANFEALQLEGSANLTGYGNDLANNLQGNAGNNRLEGNAGVDTINGNDGDDTLVGGVGNDLLRGGSGGDIFRVYNESVGNAALETDTVYDFSAAEGDIIDISSIVSGDADGAFSLVAAFSKQAGQMTLTFAAGVTTLRLDVNGDAKVDYQMKINGDVTGESGDWVL